MMNWWERFWYSVTHPGVPVPDLGNDEAWDSFSRQIQEGSTGYDTTKSYDNSGAAVGGSPDFPGSGSGSFINDVTGVTASNQFSAQEAEKQRQWETSERLATQEFNSAEAKLSRDWSEQMESTRYQRTIHDLAAAGVNPMLAFMNGSASVAGAGSTSAANVSPGSGSHASASGNSASAVSGIIRALTTLVKAL